MQKLFIPYELAVIAKEKGFDEPCIAVYLEDKKLYLCGYSNKTNGTLTPLYQQIIDWFREKHNTVINVYANASGYLFEFHDSALKGGTHRYDSGFDGPNAGGCWDNYYEALNKAIEESFKLI